MRALIVVLATIIVVLAHGQEPDPTISPGPNAAKLICPKTGPASARAANQNNFASSVCQEAFSEAAAWVENQIAISSCYYPVKDYSCTVIRSRKTDECTVTVITYTPLSAQYCF